MPDTAYLAAGLLLAGMAVFTLLRMAAAARLARALDSSLDEYLSQEPGARPWLQAPDMATALSLELLLRSDGVITE